LREDVGFSYSTIPSVAHEEDVLNQRVATGCTVSMAIIFPAVSFVIFSSGDVTSNVPVLPFPLISLIVIMVAIGYWLEMLSFECMPTIWRVILATCLASQLVAFYFARDAELKKFPELWLPARGCVRSISVLAGIIVASMPRKMRWKLVTMSMVSLASCVLCGYLLFRIGVTWPNGYFTLIYFLEHIGAAWIGMGSMHAVSSYLTATYSQLRGRIAESELRIGELEQARRDALERDFLIAYQRDERGFLIAYQREHGAPRSEGSSEKDVRSDSEWQSESAISSASHHTVKLASGSTVRMCELVNV
jgi:hypothetical protein